jgi:sugar/nucleoside kinase (ribokinase family)
MAAPGGPVVCFSYLAAASLWKVVHFPRPNTAAEIYDIEASIAADAPMVAATLTALSEPVLLLTNDIGDDVSGTKVHGWLRRHHVRATSIVKDEVQTPQITVIGDNHHTRTIFPFLPGVNDDLEHVDLAPLARASFAYIDGYGVIGKAASLAIRAAKAAEVPLLLNLGGDSPAEVFDAIRGYPGLVVQTSVAEDSAPEAQRLAVHLQDATQAKWVVITAGAAGAAAAGARDLIRAPAFDADVRHTHCAGAAFSGGLIHGLLHGWPMRDCLDLASASGALRCERAHNEPMPSLAELQALIASRQRVTAPAA